MWDLDPPPYIIHGSLNPVSQPLKRHLDRFSRFCRAHERDQQTDHWRKQGFRVAGAEAMKCAPNPQTSSRGYDASSPIFGYAKLISMVISHQILARLFCALSPASSGGNCPPLPPLPKLRHRGGHEISLITSNHRVF